jgi:hydroxymethylpyrimidine pyrophosphatase-like HAD family hydrolase
MIISFDFDGTLEDEFGGFPKNNQKEYIQSLARKYINEGHDVMILTKRYGPELKDMGLRGEYLPVYYLARELGIEKVYFTNREMKFSYILNMKIDIHFENDEYEVDLINRACSENTHNCLVIPVEEYNWKDLIKDI